MLSLWMQINAVKKLKGWYGHWESDFPEGLFGM